MTPASDGDATYYLWDFGGQDIYHSAHTLFMRTAAVFVVLWTPEQEALVTSANDDDTLQRRHPLTYWLNYVRTLGRPDSPVVVVQSQCDAPAQEVTVPPVDKALQESFGCLRYRNFSARTRRGAASLQEALADANAYLRVAMASAASAGAATWCGSNWRPGARPINSCRPSSACTAPSAKRILRGSVNKSVV
jgi:internalin A